MSGGYFEYKNTGLQDEIFNYESKPWNALEDREISELTWDLLELLNAFDYYKSGDKDKDTYIEKKAAFKKKWLEKGTRKKRIKDTIDKAIEDVRQELYQTYDISTEEEAE